MERQIVGYLIEDGRKEGKKGWEAAGGLNRCALPALVSI